MRPIPPYLQHHVHSASSGTCQALPLRTPGSICAASLRYIPLLSTGAKEPAHTLAAATKRVLAEKHAALCGKKQQAYEYNTSCSEPAVHGGARRQEHWQRSFGLAGVASGAWRCLYCTLAEGQAVRANAQSTQRVASSSRCVFSFCWQSVVVMPHYIHIPQRLHYIENTSITFW